MATYSQTRLVGNIANDAEFRVWGKFLSDSMEAAGWTKTADTGQINWTTVTKPVAINTVAGYEIRKSPTKTGYTDFYIKFEYGVGGNVTYTSMWITTGTTTDGAGTLTGVVATRYQKVCATATGGVEDLVSGGEDWLALVWTSATSAGFAGGAAIAFERRTDADGNYQTDGLAVLLGVNQITQSYEINSSGQYTVYVDAPLGYIPPSYAGTAGTVFIAPAMVQAPVAHYPMRALCYIAESNTGSGATFSFAMFPGKTQTWRGTYLTISAANTRFSVIPGDVSPVIRWE